MEPDRGQDSVCALYLCVRLYNLTAVRFRMIMVRNTLIKGHNPHSCLTFCSSHSCSKVGMRSLR